ncbi:MAG: hypothetical protein U1E61_21460 [Bradyrhizobium sp.]|mgnify:CR=1 FL=1
MGDAGKVRAVWGVRLKRALATGGAAIASLAAIGSSLALASDTGDATAPALPNIYVDLRTNYATLPANSLSIGLGNSSLFSTLGNLKALIDPAMLPAGSGLPGLPMLSSPASQSAWIDVPLTIDVSDRISLYGGFTASASNNGSGWSSLDVTSWNLGFQADVYQQNGGSFPTVTLQTTVTQSVPDSPLMVTTLNNIVELGYALDEDETRGWLAGVQHTKVSIDSPLARVNDNIVGWVGGYYQWPDNWKFTGRVGLQSFGGAQILRLAPFQPFTQPIVRLDLDRMDDNDNRLFGVTAQIAWVPKPSYTLTLRTPLYLMRN